MNMLKLLLTSVKTHIPRFNKKKIANVAAQNIVIVVSRPKISPHSLVASVSIVPRIAKTPIIAPRIKNHIPESKTPSNTGSTVEITGRSLFGNRIPYRIRKIIVETKPKTKKTQEDGGSLSPWINSPINEPTSSDIITPRNS
tara:strand:- start:2169 stop:2594 length:426 start_codon:yes stop_codon:yes gene_type:complete